MNDGEIASRIDAIGRVIKTLTENAKASGNSLSCACEVARLGRVIERLATMSESKETP